MIDPLNPGPAGSQGPAGNVIAGPQREAIDGVLQYGTAVIGQAIQATLQAIRQALDPAINTVQSAISSAAGSVASAINAGQTTLALSQAQIQTAVGQSVAAATAPAGRGGAALSGVEPGQYPYQLWSRKTVTGWLPPILIPTVGPQPSGTDYCFVGGWEDVIDAIRYQATAPALPPGACPAPGGPAVIPTGGPVTPTQCTQWAVWVFPSGSSSPCSYPYCNGSVPDPSGVGGSKMLFPDQASAQAFVASSVCTTGGTGGGGPQYYGGCVNGSPVSWSSTDQTPTGVSGQVGPFSSATAALAAAGSCSATIINPPGGGTGNQGGTQCCPTNADGSFKLPDCIYLDLCGIEKVAQAITKGLCDWSQNDDCFFVPIWRAIKKGLCEFVMDPECLCKIRDSDVAIYEDCDGDLTKVVEGWMGKTGAALAAGTSLDQLLLSSRNLGQ